MEAPKCQFCGKKEWRHVCDQTPAVPSVSSFKEAGAKLDKLPAPKRSEARVKELVEANKPKFDRTAYQREYMRKRRAKK